MFYKIETDAKDFPFWSGAAYNYRHIQEAGRQYEEAFNEHLEYVFSDYLPEDTEINDYVWFDIDTILDCIGLDTNFHPIKEEE